MKIEDERDLEYLRVKSKIYLEFIMTAGLIITFFVAIIAAVVGG